MAAEPEPAYAKKPARGRRGVPIWLSLTAYAELELEARRQGLLPEQVGAAALERVILYPGALAAIINRP
jgi:hypothetical protein